MSNTWRSRSGAGAVAVAVAVAVAATAGLGRTASPHRLGVPAATQASRLPQPVA